MTEDGKRVRDDSEARFAAYAKAFENAAAATNARFAALAAKHSHNGTAGE